MTHEKWKEFIQLSIYGELSDIEQRELEEHLETCQGCREELAQLQRFQHLMSIGAPPRVDASVLNDARRNLRTVLAYESTKPGIRVRMLEWYNSFKHRISFLELPTWQSAARGLAMAGLGVVIGLYYSSPQSETLDQPLALTNQEDVFTRGDVDISNVRFLDADPSDGSIEFVFEAVRPVQMKGALDDPMVQRVLSFAVVNEQNPGVRLKAVNAAGAYTQVTSESTIKNALITALKTDPNSGVRKEAFFALVKYPFDDSVKDAMVHVLTHDDNAALRIEAINMLQARAEENIPFDQDLVDVLKTRMVNDKNTYIRTRARTVLDNIDSP